MQTCISRQVRADPAIVFQLVAAVEDWPRLLPHYRWVRVLSAGGAQRTVAMAARRDVCAGLGIPLRWTSIVTLYERSQRVEFEHVGGITRGMRVAWTIEPSDGGALEVQIRHEFHPRWPVPDVLVDRVVGEYFVNGVARRTLRHIGELAEARTRKQT